MNFSSEHLQIDPTKEQVMGTTTFGRRRVIGDSSLRAVVRCGVCAIVIAGVWSFGNFTARAADEKERSADPLGDITQDMKAASRWLGKMSTDVLTQETQKDAVDKLDVLIAELEKQAEKFKAGQSSPNPSKPLPDSVVKAGPGGMGKLHGPNDDGKHWADLPPHERERILQSMNDGFPAHYQGVLAAYFKHLAEEKSVKNDDAPASSGVSAKPTTPAPSKLAPDAKEPTATTTAPDAK
jgi:hypothetical protein